MRWPFSLSVWTGLAALSLVFASNASAGFWDVDYEGHRTWWMQISGGSTLQSLDGDLRLGGSVDTDLDIEDTLDIGEERAYWTRLDFQPFLRHHFRFTYMPLAFKGSRDLDPGEGISINGQGFSLGRIKSEFQLDSYEFAYQWDALYLGEQVTISPIVNIALLDASAEFTHDVGGAVDVDEDDSFLIPIPSVGLRIEGYPARRIGLFGEAKGMTIGSQATTWDVEGGVELFLSNHLSVQARYRYAFYDVDVSDILFDANLSGPYFGLGFRF